MHFLSNRGRFIAAAMMGILGFVSCLSAQTNETRLVVLLVGPPGSGKSTQAAKLSGQYRIPSITMADVLKKEGGGKTALNKQLKANIASGDMVSDEIANNLIAQRISRKDCAKGFILDGYPNTEKQAEYLEALLQDRGLPGPLVVFIDVPDAVAADRMKRRGRADDTPENIARRLQDFHNESDGILKRYSGARLRRVDGTQPLETVWQAIKKSLASEMAAGTAK